MIKIKNVVKSYGHETVLKHVSAEMEAGKIHGIIGRNGSGKTVLMKCIAGLASADSGTISVGGKIVGKDIEMPANLGAIIEVPGFLPNYSGFRNLKFLADIRHRIGNEDVRRAMKRVGLDPDSRKWVSKYSLGMRQRLGIAQAIMEKPKLLILDEPMNGLDNHGVLETRALLAELREEGKTLLIASHNPLDIEELCDHVYEMDAGKMVQKY